MKTIFLVLLMMFLATTSFAKDAYMTGPSFTKLKRGALNVLTAPAEIPMNIKSEWGKGKAHPIGKTVAVFGGIVKGLAYTVGRVGSGVWDMVTLNIDVPGNNEPLMKPDFFWRDKRD